VYWQGGKARGVRRMENWVGRQGELAVETAPGWPSGRKVRPEPDWGVRGVRGVRGMAYGTIYYAR